MRKKRAWPTTPKEFRHLGRVFCILAGLRLLLPCVKLNRLLGWLALSRVPQATDLSTLQKTVRYVDALLWRFPAQPKGNCLPRSLALYYFATRCGFPVQFHCGVRRMGAKLQGHAWLSLKGEPFLENGNPFRTYTVTFSFPDATQAGANVAHPTGDATHPPKSVSQAQTVREAPPPSAAPKEIATLHEF